VGPRDRRLRDALPADDPTDGSRGLTAPPALAHPGKSAPIRVGLDAHAVGRRQTGNETYVVELATALARRRDVRPVAYLDRDVAWPDPEGPRIERLRWRSRTIRLGLELPVRARRDRLDLLHVQYVAPPVAGTPVVVTIHDLSFVDVPDDLPTAMVWRLRATVGLAVRRAAVVLTVSEFTRRRLLEHYRLDPDRVIVTPNGVASRWQPLADDERDARLRTAGLTDLPERFVLGVGARHVRKDFDRLVRAVAAVRAEGESDVGLVLAGPDGTATPAIAREIRRLHAEHWTRIVGYVPDEALPALAGAAAAVAMPSRYEGFGLPVLEAQACGAVVVSVRAGAIPEVAGEAAILVEPGSDDALADGLRTALTDTTLRASLAVAGPRHAAGFTWDRCAAATVEGYRRALAE